MNLINPRAVFGPLLNTVQSPARYLGGEYGITVKKHDDTSFYFNVAMAFPDMYEIGMSNLAIRIIYNGLNAYDDIRCERTFAPDTDFEALLKSRNIPLYTLETGMPLCETDAVCFSIGYELGATEVLAMLDLGKIPLKCSERTEKDPIIIAGGCGVTNPAPLSDFIDAFMIGEAEDGLFPLIKELSSMKKNGASRKEMLDLIKSKPFMWTKDKDTVAQRAVQSDFGLVPSVPSWFPLPSIKPVQDHGVVEIMRGCPNGCRFCHAGVYYRPTRVKNIKLIIEEIDHLVFDAGYREISLNSLSSADYPDIGGLLDILNERYKGYNVSFQLPSLKVNSMSLDILEKLNQVRKSGLTFAVETPEEAWQLSLNKEVYAQHLESIIKEAKARGWSSAKFYFMIGLPVGDYWGKENNPSGKSEEETIVEFMTELQARTKIQCNVNVGVFIPKPHTAYQWVRQISVEEAQKKIDYIYKNLPRGKFRLGRHNFDATLIEGLLSRGDQRVGSVILDAYNRGARLDAWDEHLKENHQHWMEAFENASFNVMDYIYRSWSVDEKLPWDNVSMGVGKAFYRNEWLKSQKSVLTKRCEALCSHSCGICSKQSFLNEKIEVHTKETVEAVSPKVENRTIVRPAVYPESNIPVLYRVIFTFDRARGAEYIAYLAQVEIFHKAILRSTLPFVFTTGFNPLPRLEFASAMTLGVESFDEIASCVLYEDMEEKDFIEKMNAILPEEFRITKAFIFPVTNMRKRESLSQNVWGSTYIYKVTDPAFALSFREYVDSSKVELENFIAEEKHEGEYEITVGMHQDKKFRTGIEEKLGKPWYDVVSITKTATVASYDIQGWTAEDEKNWRYNNAGFVKEEDVNIRTKGQRVSYYELYEDIAKVNADLINVKKDLNKRREEFYASHPEVREKHLKEDLAKGRIKKLPGEEK